MLNLVYDSMFLLRELRVGQVLLRRRTRRWTLHIWIYLFTVRCLFRMSTRRLYVILIVLLFNP